MPPDKPAKQSGPSKRHRRSRSVGMASSVEIIDLTNSSKPENSSSRKHGRHENDCQAQGPSKRAKTNRGSEPPMRKDTSMTPKTKRKRGNKNINNRKASRTSNHQEFKGTIKALKRELEQARQAHDDTRREMQEDLDWHAKDLKRLQQQYDEQADEVRNQEQRVATACQENQEFERQLQCTANEVEALQISCQNKGRELNANAEGIIALQKELGDSKHQSESLEKSLHTAELEINRKDGIITALKKDIDDHKQYSGSLEKALDEKEAALKRKDELDSAKQKKLEKTEQQCAALKESLGEEQRALKASKRAQSDCCKELATMNEKLGSKNQKLSETEMELEEKKKEIESLSITNDGNGHRNFLLRSREKKAKDEVKEQKAKVSALEAGRTELQEQYEQLETDLEAQKSERNQAVARLQRKLKESRLQNQRYNYKEPDEKIKEDFANLEVNIRQFADKYARPVPNATDQELKIDWPGWSPELRSFLASPFLCNLVLEAYVWERLLARVFTPGSKIWAGELGRSLEKTLSMVAEETAEAGFKSELFIDYQYLRSSASSLIQRLDGGYFRPKYFDQDVMDMVSTLAKLGLHKTGESMKSEAMEIFKQARDLAIQLRMLKAEYSLRMHQPISVLESLKYGFAFVDETMVHRSPAHDKDLGQAPAVDFIISPGLYKRGDNNGTNYEAKACTVKMNVVCNAAKFFLKAGGSSSARERSSDPQDTPRPNKAKQEGESITLQSNTNSTPNKGRKESSIENPYQVKNEDANSQRRSDFLSTSGLSSGSPLPKPHHTTQKQSVAGTNMRTRSQDSPKTGSKIHGGKSNNKSQSNHPFPTGPATGRGGSTSPGKRHKHGKGSERDPDYIPGSDV